MKKKLFCSSLAIQIQVLVAIYICQLCPAIMCIQEQTS